jgi:hypothetical protein
LDRVAKHRLIFRKGINNPSGAKKLKAQTILALVLENYSTPLLIIDSILLLFAHKNFKKNMSSLQKALETAHQEQPPAFAQIGGTAKKKKKKNRTEKNDRNFMPVKPKIVISTPAHDDDDDSDDGSCSSSSSSDDSNVDANEEEQKQQNNDSEDMMKIRQQAFDLLNKSSGPTPNNKKSTTTTTTNGFSVSSYQQQSTGEQSNTTYHNTDNNHSSSSYQSSPYAMHNPNVHPNARTADKMSMTDLIVNCVSDVCRSSSSEILSKGVSLVSAGYKSVSNYGDKPVSGTFDSIDTSQHGYGNSNNVQRAYPARYQD